MLPADRADVVPQLLQGDTRGLAPREQAIVRYTNLLTCNPKQITGADIEPLRAVGLDDHCLHDLVQVAAYFAYANRVALGLGVEIPPDEPLGAWPDEDA